MLLSSTELSELVCTRISHDLIGNIGALSGALELIAENHDTLDTDTLGILKTATSTLKARQKFFRIAFGANTVRVEMTELMNICLEYLQTVGSHSSNILFNCKGITPDLAKICCICVMTAAEVFIRGGIVDVSVNKQNLQICATSDYKLAYNKICAYQNIIDGKLPDENVSQYVQLIYLQQIIAGNPGILLEHNENTMKIIIG